MTRDILSIDIETRSARSLRDVGVYAYTADAAFDVLLFGYSLNGGKVEVIDLTKEPLPRALVDMITSGDVLKTAYNAQFERIALSRYLHQQPYTIDREAFDKDGFLKPDAWRDTMALAAYAGISGALGQVAEYLGLEQQKDTAGTRLIRLFSNPTRDGGFTAPTDKPEEWELFKYYCAQDVRTEQAILRELLTRHSQPTPAEVEAWTIDQRINDAGVMVDLELARAACDLSQRSTAQALERMKVLTGLENPNSVAQLKRWLEERGCNFETLGKDAVSAALARGDLPKDVQEVLTLRIKTAKSSTKKYVTMTQASARDSRVRGLFQYYGAATGRWAGRLLQVQNLPRGYSDERLITLGRRLVLNRDQESIELLFESTPDLLKQLIRSAIIAPVGKALVVCDFSAIEARVIAWLAGEDWVLDVFRGDGKIYEATAARMLGKPIEDVTKADRQKGKVATLALGYQGGAGALERMGAAQMGIAPSEYEGIVWQWRRSNQRIVRFWYDLQTACIEATRSGHRTELAHGLRVGRSSKTGALMITLPSGRVLHYHQPRVREGGLSFVDTSSRGGYARVETYGGKLAENVVQAVARDLLANALSGLQQYAAELRVVMHVHDEIVAEANEGDAQRLLDVMNKVMCCAPTWADGLPLSAAGFTTKAYRKD